MRLYNFYKMSVLHWIYSSAEVLHIILYNESLALSWVSLQPLAIATCGIFLGIVTSSLWLLTQALHYHMAMIILKNFPLQLYSLIR